MAVDKSGRRIDVGTSLGEVARCAGALARRGVGRGDRVAFTLRANPEFVAFVYLGWPAVRPVAYPRRLPVDRRHSTKIDRPALAAWLTSTGQAQAPSE